MSDEEDNEGGVSWAYDFVAPLEQRGSAVLVLQRAEEANDKYKGTTLFVASTDSEDRAMDVVKQDWRLRNFRANSVILDNHEPMRVVGRSIESVVPRTGDDAGRLMIRVGWDLENPDPSIRSVGHQHLAGYRRAGSVGFKHGKKTARNKLDQSSPYYREPVKVETWWGEYEMSGYLYESNELLEFSSATIPMNAEALQRSIVAAYAECDPADLGRRGNVASETGIPKATVANLLEMARAPEHRSALLDLLWPDLVGRMKTDAEVKRIMQVHALAVPAAAPTKTTDPHSALLQLVAAGLKESA